MYSVNEVRSLIEKMSDNNKLNIKFIKEKFLDLNFRDEEEQSILHIFCNYHYDEDKCLLAIKALLENGISPNLEDEFNYNFIQTALYAGYSEEFILNIIKEGLKYNLDVNHVDEDMDTIMHTAIYSDGYLDRVDKIFDLLCSHGFDYRKKDGDERDLVEAMIYQEQYDEEEIDYFKNKFEGDISNNKNRYVPSRSKLSKNDILELEKFGVILNNRNYDVEPAVGREKELNNIFISLAQDKKSPLIIGESGVGKTAIILELAYKIKNKEVPRFLQDKIILEVNPSELVAGCSYVGTFEEKIAKLMDLCRKFDIILFIDEIHTMYGTGTSNKNDSDMAGMLKYYIDRFNLKVIGTTTIDEYQEYFSTDALKRRFDKVVVKEPNEVILRQILNKVFIDHLKKDNILLENEDIINEIINILLFTTNKKHRVYNDVVNNPDLAISIIDYAFAITKVYDCDFVEVEHFIQSINNCNRINSTIKQQAINKLKKLEKPIDKPKQKVIDFKLKS